MVSNVKTDTIIVVSLPSTYESLKLMLSGQKGTLCAGTPCTHEVKFGGRKMGNPCYVHQIVQLNSKQFPARRILSAKRHRIESNASKQPRLKPSIFFSHF